jgi:hypothetical protein
LKERIQSGEKIAQIRVQIGFGRFLIGKQIIDELLSQFQTYQLVRLRFAQSRLLLIG